MASFASEILNFNPHVSQLPVDDYLRTGLILQERYNQGVEFIQDQLDNVAGLPVATEADKKYLNSKVTAMESQVRGIASADFSRMSIQQQVGAMANRIARDPVIQNSVLSSQRISQLKNSIAELRRTKPELYTVANEKWIDENFLTPFYQQGKTQTGLLYSGPTDAIPYTDYRKLLNEELSKIEPSVQTITTQNGELAFKIDKSTTVTPARVQNIINSIIASRPDIQQQMQIDGYFAYKHFTPQTFYSHITDTYNDQIAKYQQMDSQTRELMNANPNDYGLISQATEKLRFIKTQVGDLVTKRDRYLDYINKGEVDLVKQTLFGDALRDGYVLKYARDNHAIEYDVNKAALAGEQLKLDMSRNWLEYVKAGVDPETRKALDVNDPLYQIHLRATARGKGKSKDDEDDDQIQTVAVPGESAKTYTVEANNERIATLDSNLKQQENNLRDLYFKKLGPNAATDPAAREKSFRDYVASQTKLYNSPDPNTPLDNEFAQFMDATMQDRALKQTLINTAKKIGEDAVKKYPISDIIPATVRFRDIQIYEPNGSVRVNDVVANKDVIEKALEVRNAVQTSIARRTPPVPSGSPVYTSPTVPETTLKDYEEAAGKYKNDPNYKYILSLARDRQLIPLQVGGDKQIRKRGDEMDARFRDMGRTASFLATPFTESQKNKSEIKDMVVAAAAITPGNPEVNASEVVPIDFYNNLEGKLVVRYQKNHKDKEIHEAIVESDVNVFGNPNPYFKVQQSIDLSADKSTPRDENALSSKNGKIKYAVSYNPLTGYQASILKNGYWFTLPTYSTIDGYNKAVPFKSIAEIVQKIEQLSQYPADVYEEAFKNTFSTPTPQK